LVNLAELGRLSTDRFGIIDATQSDLTLSRGRSQSSGLQERSQFRRRDPGVGRAIRGSFGQPALHQVCPFGRDVGRQFVEPNWIDANVCEHQLIGIANVRKRSLARDGLVQNQARGINVRTAIDGLSLRLLGRHIARRTNGDPARGHHTGRAVLELGDAEVEQFGATAVQDKDVLRLYVAMDGPSGVSRMERVEHIGHDGTSLSRREPPLLGNPLPQVATL